MSEPLTDELLAEWEKLVPVSDPMWKPALLACIQEVRRLTAALNSLDDHAAYVRERERAEKAEASRQECGVALENADKLAADLRAEVERLKAQGDEWERLGDEATSWKERAEKVEADRDRYRAVLQKIQSGPWNAQDVANFVNAVLSQPVREEGKKE